MQTINNKIQKPITRRQSTLSRQEQIVDAAQKVIVKYGSEHITIRRIAKEVGISEGAIYRHFKSKRDILSLMIDDIEKNLVGDTEQSAAASQSPLQTLDNMLSNHLSPIAQRRGVSFQVIAKIISLGDRRLNKKLSDVIKKYIDHVKSLLNEGIKAGEIRDDINVEATATLFFSLVQGLVSIWTLDNYRFSLVEKYLPLWQILRKSIIKQ
ncbi:MAG: TetR/AcrR family transcriptional regulator [Chloroflexota bacterium]